MRVAWPTSRDSASTGFTSADTINALVDNVTVGSWTNAPRRAPTAVTRDGVFGMKKHSAIGTMGPPGLGLVLLLVVWPAPPSLAVPVFDDGPIESSSCESFDSSDSL